MDTHTRIHQKDEEVQTNLVCQKVEGIYFLGQERSIGGAILAKMNHDDVRGVLLKQQKNSFGPFRTKGMQC
jgi:hypothetical protein